MKKSFLIIIFTFVIFIVFLITYAKIKTLQNKINDLTEELAQYKVKPDLLFEKARIAYQNKNDTLLLSLSKQLQEYHPRSKERRRADILYKRLDSIRKLEEAEKIEKERREQWIKDQERENRKKQMMSALNKLKKSHDDVSGITWYKNPYFTHYTNSHRTSVYIGQRYDRCWLRLQMSYYGENWIFFEKAYLSYDGSTMEIPFSRYGEKESENSGGYVWEWIDVEVTSNMVSFLERMVNEGKSVKMRLSGKYEKTRVLSSNEIKGIKDVLLGYKALKEGEL